MHRDPFPLAATCRPHVLGTRYVPPCDGSVARALREHRRDESPPGRAFPRARPLCAVQLWALRHCECPLRLEVGTSSIEQYCVVTVLVDVHQMYPAPWLPLKTAGAPTPRRATTHDTGSRRPSAVRGASGQCSPPTPPSSVPPWNRSPGRGDLKLQIWLASACQCPLWSPVADYRRGEQQTGWNSHACRRPLCSLKGKKLPHHSYRASTVQYMAGTYTQGLMGSWVATVGAAATQWR